MGKQKRAKRARKMVNQWLICLIELVFVARLALIVIISLTKATDSVNFSAVWSVGLDSEYGQFPVIRETMSHADFKSL